MTYTVLQTAQAVARGVGLNPPTSLVGSADDTAQRILQAIREAGRLLALRDWRALQYEYLFTTSAGVTDYVLPSSPSWARMVAGTDWDRTNFSRMNGAQTARQWQDGAGAGLATSFFSRPWRVKMDAGRAAKFSLLDDPGGSYSLAFEYITDQWLYDGSALYLADVTADANQPVYDPLLLELATTWRVRKTLGLAYGDDQMEARRVEDRLFAGERARDICLGTERYYLTNNTPEVGYG